MSVTTSILKSRLLESDFTYVTSWICAKQFESFVTLGGTRTKRGSGRRIEITLEITGTSYVHTINNRLE